MSRAQHGSDGRFVAAHEAEPTPLAAPPQPMGVGVLRTQQNRYDQWIAAGGTPPIYTNFTVSGGIVTNLP
jgi:hypothetical protein